MYPIPEENLKLLSEWIWHNLRLRPGVIDAASSLEFVPISTITNFHAHWQDPDLLLSQSCGYPVANILGPAVHVIGAFHYDVEGCEDDLYSSVFIANVDDERSTWQSFQGSHFIANSSDSESGTL